MAAVQIMGMAPVAIQVVDQVVKIVGAQVVHNPSSGTINSDSTTARLASPFSFSQRQPLSVDQQSQLNSSHHSLSTTHLNPGVHP